MAKPRSTRAPRFVTNQYGGGWWDTIKAGAKKVHGFVKDNKLLSKGLNAIGQGGYAKVADQAGYGRPRPRRRRVAPSRSSAGRATGSSVIRFR